jgi:hypothetical protein
MSNLYEPSFERVYLSMFKKYVEAKAKEQKRRAEEAKKPKQSLFKRILNKFLK